ncbi:DMT family transporter [Acidimicrobiaceae bacterium]|nr:DMT family transporter [Acidimicrobiaceae bacterium]|tara:strand:- start:4092 stop:4919 length:828 start_codon:yes stop_codon:yes gene_type:complete
MLISEKNKSLIALFFSALFFGSTFLIVKNLLVSFSPTFIVFMRYIIASIFFLVIGGIPNSKTIKPGLLMGIFLWLGYITQTQGLVTTSTINSGVVTGFYIVLTPFFSKLINKTQLNNKNYIYSFLGFLGIVLISITDITQIFGNIFTMFCAFSYAMHIVLVERYIDGLNISQLMFVQSFTGAVLCIPFTELNQINNFNEYWLPILFLGLVVNVSAFYLQLYGQRIIKASTSALILSLEAIFALFIGILLAGETLNLLSWGGVLLVLISIFLVIKE